MYFRGTSSIDSTNHTGHTPQHRHREPGGAAAGPRCGEQGSTRAELILPLDVAPVGDQQVRSTAHKEGHGACNGELEEATADRLGWELMYEKAYFI